MIFLDTHLLVWLYEGELDLISDQAKKLLESQAILISPIVKLELEYLHEIKRLKHNADKIFSYLNSEIGIEFSKESFGMVIEKSIKEKWTRDPFDRIITAHARLLGFKLITKDQKIHRNYSLATW